MREIFKLSLKLFIISAVAGLALGIVNEITKEQIVLQTAISAENSRKSVFKDADEFVPAEFEKNDDNEDIKDVYMVKANGELLGCVCTVTSDGYGGKDTIDVMVGIDTNGELAGISVGGPSFSETAGLGAKSKDKAFTDMFKGLEYPVSCEGENKNYDAITGATKTSRFVGKAVNRGCEFMEKLLKEVG